jgi:hypothetical protein
MAPGVPWGIYALVTFEVSNPAFACCIGEICQVLDEDQCQAAGGIWHGGELLCDPNPCADFACCVGDTCVVLSYADCSRAGGEWLSGLEECDPFPCSDFACCIQEHCMLMNLGECLTAGGEWRAGITTCDDELCLPSTVKLSGGVLLAHAPAGITYTSGADWCAYYADSVAVTHSYQQVPRIDPPGPETPAVWYVLAGWPESKEWCTTTFGLGEYDPLAFLIFEADPCHGGGVEAHTAAWPGPHEGTQVVHAVKWQGNYEPVYAFVSYAYGAGRIPLEAFSYAGSAGFTNCRGTDYPIDCYGALGVYQDGVECHPAGERFACCLAEGCSLLDESACLSGGGTWQPGTVSCDPDPCSGQGIAAPAGGSPGWLSCAPNPFASALEVNYRTGGRAEAAELAVYDITGRCVRLLSRGSSPGSGQRVVWDGRDDRGARAPSGIYFVRLTLPGGPLGQRVLLLRGVVE